MNKIMLSNYYKCFTSCSLLFLKCFFFIKQVFGYKILIGLTLCKSISRQVSVFMYTIKYNIDFITSCGTIIDLLQWTYCNSMECTAPRVKIILTLLQYCNAVGGADMIIWTLLSPHNADAVEYEQRFTFSSLKVNWNNNFMICDFKTISQNK